MKRILPFLFLLIATMAFSKATAQQISKAYFCNIWGNNVPKGLCTFDPSAPNEVTQIDSTLDFNAADYTDGYIYAYIRDPNEYPSNYFCKIQPDDGSIVSRTQYTPCPNDITWDETTKTMFFISGNTFGTSNLETGEMSPIGATSCNISCIMCQDGQLYGISELTGILYSIDKNTAALTEIGSTGLTPKYQQTASVDPLTGICYWCYSDAQKDCLYTIDLTTGETTFLRNFAECTGLCFIVSDITGINEETSATSIYPNPASDRFTVSVSNATRCTLCDTQGRIVSDMNAKGQETVEFKTEDLPAGVYFLTICHENAPSITSKVVVAK